MEININNIEILTENIFQKSTEKDYSSLKEFIQQLKKMKVDQFPLYEIIKNDFEYYWNVLQANYFLKNEESISFSLKIPIMPFVWLEKWKEYIDKRSNEIDNKGYSDLSVEN